MIKRLSAILLLFFFVSYAFAGNSKTDSLLFFADDLKSELGNIAFIGSIPSDRSELDSSLNRSLMAYEMAIKLGDKQNQSILAHEIGSLFYESGEAGLAEYYLEQSLNVAHELQDTVLLLDNYIELGRSLTYQERYLKALEWLLKGELLAEEYGKAPIKARFYNAVAAVNLYTGNFDEAIENYQQALDIFTLIKSKENEMLIKNNMAGVFMEKGENPVKALEYFSECARYNKERGQKVWEGFCYNNIATVYYRQKDFFNAEEYFLKALRLLENQKMNYYVADVYFSLGDLYSAQGRMNRAMDFYLKSYDLASEIGSYKVLSVVCKRLSEKNEKDGNLEKALQYYKEYKQASDSMVQQKSKEALSQLKTSYVHQRSQMELQEKYKVQQKLQKSKLEYWNKVIWILVISLTVTIGLLVVIFRLLKKKEKTEKELRNSHKIVQVQKEELENMVMKLKVSEKDEKRLNASKDKLFSIISHDLITPYSAIFNQFEYIIESYEKLTDEERKESIEDIQESFQVNYLLVNNLLEWSRLQTNNIQIKPKSLELRWLVDEVCKVYEEVAANKNVQVLNQIENGIAGIADEHMVKTVFRNLIDNGIKFSREDGFVVIGALVRDNDIVVSVHDNGVGISKENQEKLFKIEEKISTIGTANEKGTGLGLILCKDIIEKNNGTIWYETFEGKGTTIKFRLPIN